MVKDFGLRVIATEGNADFAEFGGKRVEKVNDLIFRSQRKQERTKLREKSVNKNSIKDGNRGIFGGR